MILPELHVRTDDAFLLRFLRAKKFDYDRAFNLLMTHYKMKQNNPELFTNLRPSAVKHVLEAGVTGVLPHRDKDGRRVMVFRPGKQNNPELFTNLRPSAVKHVLEAGVTGVLPHRDKDGRRVMVFRPGKQNNPELFLNLRPSAVKHVLEAGVTGVLPHRDKDGRRVMVFRPGIINKLLIIALWIFLPLVIQLCHAKRLLE